MAPGIKSGIYIGICKRSKQKCKGDDNLISVITLGCLLYSEGEWDDVGVSYYSNSYYIIDGRLKFDYPSLFGTLINVIKPSIQFTCDPSEPNYKLADFDFNSFSVIFNSVYGKQFYKY